MRAALVLTLLPAAAPAQEFIDVPARLSDAAFYDLVSCAAPPERACTAPRIWWPQDRRTALRVGIALIDPDFPDYKVRLAQAALDAAIAEINALGADLRLERATDAPFDIPVYLTGARQGGLVSGTGEAQIDGVPIQIGRVVIRSRGADIVSAAIAISRDVRRREVASVMLEELVQAMGLPTDVRSPAYARSIFAEEGNSVVFLRDQDADALRRHYPPGTRP